MSASCFPGCTDARYAVRVIAILDFWIGVLLMIKCLSALNPFYVVAYSSTEYISYVCDAFIYLFLIFVFLYINYYLKDSTYDHKVHKIHQWLSINTMFLSFHVLAVTYIVLIRYEFRMIYYSMPICFVHSCQIYLVKYFYDEQMVRSFAAAFHNNAATVHCGHANPPDDRMITTADGRQFHQVHGTIRQQTAAAAAAATAPTAAAAAAGPQHYAADPTTIVYPRLDEGVHPSIPGSQQQYTAQEYRNPPPYTPDYVMQHIGNNNNII